MPPATPPMMPPTTAPTGPAADPFFAPSVMPLTRSSARAPTGAKRNSATAANLSRSVFMNARPFRQEVLIPHDRNQTSHPAKNVFTLNHSTISWVGGIYSHGRHGAQPYRRGLAMDLAESRRKRHRSLDSFRDAPLTAVPGIGEMRGLGPGFLDRVSHCLRVGGLGHDVGLPIEAIVNLRTISTKLLEQRDRLGGLLVAFCSVRIV